MANAWVATPKYPGIARKLAHEAADLLGAYSSTKSITFM
jgi:hypothetical protein